MTGARGVPISVLFLAVRAIFGGKHGEFSVPKKLAPDATIATVWEGLTHPRDYIANVRQKMRICKNLHGTSYVKIGVTGAGQKPCYRIIYVDKGTEAIYGSFWDTHDSLDNENAINSNWSVARMDFAEIDQLMRDKFPTPLTMKGGPNDASGA